MASLEDSTKLYKTFANRTKTESKLESKSKQFISSSIQLGSATTQSRKIYRPKPVKDSRNTANMTIKNDKVRPFAHSLPPKIDDSEMQCRLDALDELGDILSGSISCPTIPPVKFSKQEKKFVTKNPTHKNRWIFKLLYNRKSVCSVHFYNFNKIDHKFYFLELRLAH